MRLNRIIRGYPNARPTDCMNLWSSIKNATWRAAPFAIVVRFLLSHAVFL
jgi:hypothetical protein